PVGPGPTPPARHRMAGVKGAGRPDPGPARPGRVGVIVDRASGRQVPAPRSRGNREAAGLCRPVLCRSVVVLPVAPGGPGGPAPRWPRSRAVGAEVLSFGSDRNPAAWPPRSCFCPARSGPARGAGRGAAGRALPQPHDPEGPALILMSTPAGRLSLFSASIV